MELKNFYKNNNIVVIYFFIFKNIYQMNSNLNKKLPTLFSPEKKTKIIYSSNSNLYIDLYLFQKDYIIF